MDTDLVRAGRAVLSVMPLDGYVDAPVQRMEVDGRPKEQNEAHQAFAAMVEEVAGAWPMGSIDRFRFYEEARGCVADLRHPGAPPLRQRDPDQGCHRRGRRGGPAGAAGPPPPGPAPVSASAQGPGEAITAGRVSSAATVVVVTSVAISSASPPSSRARM